MESLFGCKFFVVLLGLLSSASSQVTVNVNLSKDKAQVGDTVTVTCHVTSQSDPISLITWMKRVEHEEVEIGTNKFVNPNFKGTRRYEASLQYDKKEPGIITFVLTIKNVQPVDSGNIGCKIPANSIEVFKELTVFSPISELVMTSRDLTGTHHMIHAEGQNVTFEEGERRKFVCRVNGSYPAPEVTITVGKKNITNLFEKKLTLMKSGDVLGLQALTYETTLTNDSLEISYEFSNKKLQCKATVPGSSYEPMSQSILVHLDGFTPKFECSHVHEANLHEANVQIRCVVKAEPAVEDFQVYWLEKGENTSSSLSQGKSDGHLTAAIENGETTNEHVISLNIDRVFSQHFREYVFEAENKLGRTQHKVTLKSEKDRQSKSESYRVWASLLLTLILSAIALL